MALATVATLVIARWLLRSNAAALAGWTLVPLVMTTWTGVTSGTPLAVALSVGVLSAAIQVIVLMRAGMLGYAAVYVTVPRPGCSACRGRSTRRAGTLYRSALVALVVVGLAFWAFKTALGRQSMFPAEE